MTSGSDTVTYPLGWCFTCDTNACEHAKHLNLCNRRAFNMLLHDMRDSGRMAPKIKLPGLTGEPWRKYPHG